MQTPRPTHLTTEKGSWPEQPLHTDISVDADEELLVGHGAGALREGAGGRERERAFQVRPQGRCGLTSQSTCRGRGKWPPPRQTALLPPGSISEPSQVPPLCLLKKFKKKKRKTVFSGICHH